MESRLFLIDGHALVFKMYYAFLRRPMINTKGVDTSILFGFTKYLLELIEKESPTHLAVAFDPPGGTFRNKMYPEYKANRAATPQLVIDALEPLTDICRAMNIPVLMEMGYEADDVIGSMAKRAAREGMEVVMVSPDKDYGQLVEEHIIQFKPGKGGGESEIVGVKEICEKYGIQSPLQVIDMLTICGDASDNVPGVKGVGEVGASKLIARYGSVETIYDHLEELPERQRKMFEEARDHIALSKELVTIKTDIDLSVPSSAMLLDKEYSPRIAELFSEYEFNSLKNYIAHVQEKAPETPAGTLEVRHIGAAEFVSLARQNGKIAICADADGKGPFAALRSLSIVTVRDGVCYSAEGGVSEFKALLEDASIAKAGAGLKFQINLLVSAGAEVRGPLYDVELMHYVINPERSHSLEMLASTYLGVSLSAPVEAQPTSLFDDEADDSAAGDDLSLHAAAAYLLSEKLFDELSPKMRELYETIEGPLVYVLARMERTGVKVDPSSLRDFTEQLRKDMAASEALVREIAGDPSLNVASPKQIGTLIFEKMGLDPKAKKSSKGAWSTDEETLFALADRSPVIDAILDYRATRKLLSTYIEPLPGFISPKTGRIHTTFNQALTSTGRLSSSNPNLQNIPVRTERGKEIRKAFIPGMEGAEILSADYSQIELRIMAHLSCDAHLIAAFRDGVDVHAATASKIFHVPVSEVTSDQRRIAKTANFGIMYGISSFGLAQRLQISRSEAKKIIEDYFASFPSVSAFIEDTLSSARETGYVETIFGRRRYVPDINARNAVVRSLAERNAVNAPIQGTSADIIKLAMIAIDRRMQEEKLKSLMVLQIHDELLFEVPVDEKEKMRELVTREMENVIKLSVPLTVDCNYGTNWLESH